MDIQKPKGTIDIYGFEAKKRQYVNDLINALCRYYNYDYIQTPIFESSLLFHRGVGETTDIVTKETYNFKDRGDRDMTLRPEGTASVIRSYIENKMYGEMINPVKLYYNGTMYRYERPQSGRNREFTQFGVEVFGSNDPMIDAEVISIPVNLYRLLGLKGIKVNINSLGDSESRLNYRNALVDYFKPHIDDLCDDCKNRLEKNPLRILDCKVDAENPIIKNAPKTIDYLNEESKNFFLEVQKYLDILGIEYTINPNVVRGLDYYCHTVFEVEAQIEGFGSQNVLAGGGRYNGLVKSLGGPDNPGVGFAMGIDRLMIALDKENIKLPIDNSIDISVCYILDSDKEYAFGLTHDLRLNGFKVDIEEGCRSLKNQFKKADRLNAKYIIIIGEEERRTNVITLKNNETKEEYKVTLDDLISFLDDRIGDEHEEI